MNEFRVFIFNTNNLSISFDILFSKSNERIVRYIMYFFILFLIGCSMNTTSNNKNKVSNVEFKINKKVGVQIND